VGKKRRRGAQEASLEALRPHQALPQTDPWRKKRRIGWGKKKGPTRGEGEARHGAQ